MNHDLLRFFAMCIGFLVTIGGIVGIVTGSVLLLRRAFRPNSLPMPSALDDRFDRLEQAVDAIAVEVERISEGQRFTTKLLAEREHDTPVP